MELTAPAIVNVLDDGQREAAQSPYFGTYEPFDSSKFHMRLVTRLDGLHG